MMWGLVGALGLAAGVVSGVFGVGGAVVIIPGLVLLAKLPQHTANGTSLAALLLPVSLLGVLEYYKRGEVNMRYAAITAAGRCLAPSPARSWRRCWERRACGGPSRAS
jgi:hypothetical protein